MTNEIYKKLKTYKKYDILRYFLLNSVYIYICQQPNAHSHGVFDFEIFAAFLLPPPPPPKKKNSGYATGYTNTDRFCLNIFKL